MKEYEWRYEAKLFGGGIERGKVEAATGWDAKQKVLASNELIATVEVKLAKKVAL